MKKIAHCIHHTHWDLIWYFTAQDAKVQFSYNMKEMLKCFENGQVVDFFLDGQTAPLDEYLSIHPEDREYICQLVREKKLLVGPFNSQLDCFISSGESVINNLRLGIKTAKALGNFSAIAYLPDSFGHSYDFPKIFNQFGIYDFVITRGVGDEYGVKSEFYLKSNDGSKVLVCTMIAGYGYGCYAFKEGTLFKENALDYNKISVKSLINRLLSYSTLENEFVFPLGFDQNPVLKNISKKIAYYNQNNDEFVFRSATWEDYLMRVRKYGKGLKTIQGELTSTQYHRVHRSIFSGRADIKALQDKCERILTYTLQPMAVILDSLGIPYDHGLIDSAWERLIKCQTHSSANLTDEMNEYIKQETTNVLDQISAHKIYLCKLMSISLNKKEYNDERHPLIIFNTLPVNRDVVVRQKILSKKKNFKITRGSQSIRYSIRSVIKKNYGVLRKNPALMDSKKTYYETEVEFLLLNVKGCSYECLIVQEEDEPQNVDTINCGMNRITNEYYDIYHNEEGVHIFDKRNEKMYRKAILLEDSGDEGDSFDYSYPKDDWIITDDFGSSKIYCEESEYSSLMVIKGQMHIPADLKSRKQKICDKKLSYEIKLILKNTATIEIYGKIENNSKSHRVRLLFTSSDIHNVSVAGTQFSCIKRDVYSKAMENWKENNWFEEPSSQWPLLNHVSMLGKDVISIFTKSSKEYELIGEGYTDIAVTLFRSYGAMGYPDLNRRPGRPSGLDYRIFETPKCQMLGENTFELALQYSKFFNANDIRNDYVAYATEVVSFEGQSFDKSEYPITYFPTNPLEYDLPGKYSLLEIKNNNICYGTLVKSDVDDSYILRIYNNSENQLSSSELFTAFNRTMRHVDLNEIVIVSDIDRIPGLRPGELMNIKIYKEE